MEKKRNSHFYQPYRLLALSAVGVDPNVIRTRNLLIWSQTRYHCVTESTLGMKAMLFSLTLNTFKLKRFAKYVHRKRNICVLLKE